MDSQFMEPDKPPDNSNFFLMIMGIVRPMYDKKTYQKNEYVLVKNEFFIYKASVIYCFFDTIKRQLASTSKCFLKVSPKIRFVFHKRQGRN
jgi:hypothetical protein